MPHGYGVSAEPKGVIRSTIGSTPWPSAWLKGGTVEDIAIVPYCIGLNFPKGRVMTNSKENQARAEAQFHKTIKKAQEAKQAMSQYEVDARAVVEKTAKLRALRLAKEAADKDAAEKNTQIKKMASSKKRAGRRPGKER
jgi:hypothetical protein